MKFHTRPKEGKELFWDRVLTATFVFLALLAMCDFFGGGM